MAQQQMTPEQAQALQERLKNMSPEELKAYQKQNCIFCQIISGKVDSKRIYEGDKVLAILDINPANVGHILLMPKEHYPILPLIPEDEVAALFMTAKAISNVMLKVLEAKGTHIFIANGVAAGQKAQHFMLHVIPRYDKDSLSINIPKYRVNDVMLKQLREKLIPKINELLNVKKIEKEDVKEAEIVKEEEKTSPEDNDINQILGGSDGDDDGPKQEEEEIDSEIDEDDGEESKTFITSEKAKRYHNPGCPLAQVIPEEKRIILTEEEAEESGKNPCTCITGKVLKRKEDEEKEEEPEEDEPEPDEELEEDTDDEENSGEEKPKSGIDLDKIADLLGGR